MIFFFFIKIKKKNMIPSFFSNASSMTSTITNPSFSCSSRLISWSSINARIPVQGMTHTNFQNGDLGTIFIFDIKDVPNWLLRDLDVFWNNDSSPPPSYQGRIIYNNMEAMISSKNTSVPIKVNDPMTFYGVVFFDRPPCTDPPGLSLEFPKSPVQPLPYHLSTTSNVLYMILPIFIVIRPKSVVILDLSRHLGPPCI